MDRNHENKKFVFNKRGLTSMFVKSGLESALIKCGLNFFFIDPNLRVELNMNMNINNSCIKSWIWIVHVLKVWVKN
jgi:hypothetical protein